MKCTITKLIVRTTVEKGKIIQFRLCEKCGFEGGAEMGWWWLKQARKSHLADLVRIREIRDKQKQNKQTNNAAVTLLCKPASVRILQAITAMHTC